MSVISVVHITAVTNARLMSRKDQDILQIVVKISLIYQSLADQSLIIHSCQRCCGVKLNGGDNLSLNCHRFYLLVRAALALRT